MKLRVIFSGNKDKFSNIHDALTTVDHLDVSTYEVDGHNNLIIYDMYSQKPIMYSSGKWVAALPQREP